MIARFLPHRPPPLRGLLVFALSASLFGCLSDERRGDADLQIAVDISPSPPRVGAATVSVVVTDVDWKPRNGATVVVAGTRDSLQLVIDTARGQGAGRYDAADFGFEVAGEWLLKIRVETTDGRWVEVDHALTVTADGS
jgi:hypothetical protein